MDTSRVAAVERSRHHRLSPADVAEVILLRSLSQLYRRCAERAPMFGSLDAIIKTRKARQIQPSPSTDAGVEQLDLFNLAASPPSPGSCTAGSILS